jgi:uncharacterized protein YggE
MRALVLAAALAGVAPVLPPAAAARAQELDARAMFQATTLSLSAYGEAPTRPDLATVNIGVSTQARTAVEAMRQNAQRMNATVATLRAQGIAERDIQTSGVSLGAQYAYENNQPPRLTGYQASNTVTVQVRELARLGPLLDAVVAAGSNQINGIGFGLQNPRAAEDTARREAVRAVAAKAALYAEATGLRLVRLVNLSESGGYTPTPPPRPMYRMAVAEVAAPTPVAPGELRVRVDVTAVYELGR